MQIQRLEIISFGKFKNKTIDFSSGLNIICGSNESGKSTVLSFIYTMLYGFGDNRGKGLSIREKYTPWDGGVCEGKLLLKTDSGENITVYRKAGSAKKYDTLHVYNSDTGEDIFLSPEEFVGVGSDTFFKTLCMKQLSGIIEGSNEEIVRKLSNIADCGDESASYEKAMKLLDSSRREIKPQRGEGGILSVINREITELEKADITKQSLRNELNNATVLLPSLKEKAAAVQKEYDEESQKDYTASIAHLCGRLEEKESTYKKGTKTNKNVLFLTSGTVFLILFFVLLILKVSFSFILLIPAVLCIFAGFFRKNNSLSEKDDCGIIELTLKLSQLEKEKQQHDLKLDNLKQELSLAHEKVINLETRIRSIQIALSGTDTGRLDELYRQRRIVEKKLSALTLALQALGKAHETMQKNFTPSINKKASEYFKSICGGKYTNIFCGEDFCIRIDAGIPRESAFFSGGTVDQLYFSLRLALTDMIFGEKTTFILLDQPFLQYDEKRRKNAVKLLESLPESRQILLFESNNETFSQNKKTEILT